MSIQLYTSMSHALCMDVNGHCVYSADNQIMYAIVALLRVDNGSTPRGLNGCFFGNT